MKEIDKNLQKILRKVFKNSKIPKNITKLKLGDIKEWDSLGNFNLILEVENNFKIKFDTSDFSNISSIESIKKLLKKKY
jgi:acyl carrier protein